MTNINEILPRSCRFYEFTQNICVLVKNKTHRYTGVVTDNDFTHKVAVKAYSVNTTTIESVLSAPIKAAMARCLWQMQME